MNRTQTKFHTGERKDSYKVNRTFKDGLFRLVFQEKEDLLDLYNAVNGSDYENPEDLTIYTLSCSASSKGACITVYPNGCTIDDAIYICMKNDISFLIGEMLNLYEHQSSVNPNMPMRGLLYLARNYEAYIEQNNLDIYSKVLQKFPMPQYFIFYNGSEEEPDRRPLELSDAFPKIKGKSSCLNCRATLLNINYGHNKELMGRCRKLEEYAILVYRIRENICVGLEPKEAVDRAIDSCIDDGILEKFLLKHRGEVRNVVLTSFNQENHDRILKEAYVKQGEEIGKKIGREIGEKCGEDRTKKIFKLHMAGKTPEEIAAECELTIEKVKEILE